MYRSTSWYYHHVSILLPCLNVRRILCAGVAPPQIHTQQTPSGPLLIGGLGKTPEGRKSVKTNYLCNFPFVVFMLPHKNELGDFCRAWFFFFLVMKFVKPDFNRTIVCDRVYFNASLYEFPRYFATNIFLGRSITSCREFMTPPLS